jgi:hypothetical protein
VRVGITSPVESSVESAETRSIVVPSRISIPRRCSSWPANSARLSEISGISRSRASTSTNRTPCSLQRGYISSMSAAKSCSSASPSTPA